MRHENEPVRQLCEDYQAAVWAKDAAALLALYDPDVCVFDLWSTWSYAGSEAWREAVNGWFGSLGSERVAVTFEDVQSTADGAAASLHAMVRYQSVAADGQALRAMHNRLTWVLRRKNGAWKIVHEHTSAPVNGDTMKVILQR